MYHIAALDELTETQASDDLGSAVGHAAVRVERLEQVGGEHQRDHVLGGRSDDEHLHPQLEEGGQLPVHLQDVGVVSSGFGDGGAQLGIAQSPHGGDHPAYRPHHQGEAGRTRLLDHARGRDKDARADDGADDHAHAVEQRDAAFQLDLARLDRKSVV